MPNSKEAPPNSHRSGPHLSIIIPVYNEAGNLSQLIKELGEVLLSLDMAWEVLFVDDGSSDNTWEIIESIHQGNNSVKGLRLSKNFGHQYALLAGLANGAGDALITMDGDLQHPVTMIPELVNEWRHGNMIVHTRRLDPPTLSLIVHREHIGYLQRLCGARPQKNNCNCQAKPEICESGKGFPANTFESQSAQDQQ